MGLRTWGKKQAVGLAVRRAEKELPMITKAWRWLTDPAAQGRKRGIAAGAFALGEVLRAIGASLAFACKASIEAPALLTGAWCTVDPGGWASWVDTINQVIQSITPGMELTAFAFAVWGLLHAKAKNAAAADLVRLPR